MVAFFLLFLFTSLLGIITAFYVVYHFIQLFYQKYVLKTPFLLRISLKFKIIFILMIILNVWNIYALHFNQKITSEIHQKAKNQDRRSRFILPVDYKFDEFTFPKGTRINLSNVHDSGENYRYLTLTGLYAARFPQPLMIAGVKASAFHLNSDFEFQLELSEDQKISPVYKQIYNKKENKLEIKIVKPMVLCKKGQRAEFFPIDDYYEIDTVSENYDWITLEREVFAPSKWRFEGCISAPPIHIKAMYPLPLKYDYENMSLDN